MPDRNKIIEAFERCFCEEHSTCPGCYQDGPGFGVECRKALLMDVLALLKEQEPDWISIKDRPPNCNGTYLVWRPHYYGGEIGESAICYFDGQNTWHDSYGVDFERILHPDDVTHWMPKPGPPKEVQNDRNS